MAPYHIYENVR